MKTVGENITHNLNIRVLLIVPIAVIMNRNSINFSIIIFRSVDRTGLDCFCGRTQGTEKLLVRSLVDRSLVEMDENQE